MSRVESYAASNLRYVGEAKLARLSDADLLELHKLLKYKLSEAPTAALPADKPGMIKAILDLKVRIGIISKAEADAVVSEAPAPARQAHEEQASVEEQAALQVLREQANPPPHEEHDAQGATEENDDVLSYAAAEFEKMFKPEEGTDPAVLAAEAEANKARANAFVQLAAAATPPEPEPEPVVADAPEDVIESKHRLRVCSFNALKLRLGNANRSYHQASATPGEEDYEGTQKGAELTQKWLTLSAVMADFDVILLQEVPGSEKLLEERMSTFAAMLQLATPASVEWTALPSEKSGKDGKVVGPGAECHVCFVKAPVQLRSFGTLRKAGATLLDYAPLQVVLHDPRFEDPADRDYVVTSVHMPPAPRVDARDSQIAALLRSYSAPDTSEYRMQMPWGPSKEAKLAPVHLIAGDFNTFPGSEEYKMAASGFVNKIPKKAATTVGNKHYDNVLVNTHADERFLIGGGILQLKGATEESKAVMSDHWPVFVEIVEVKKVGRDPKPEPEPEPEPAPAPAPAPAPSDATEEVPLPESTPASPEPTATDETEPAPAPEAESPETTPEPPPPELAPPEAPTEAAPSTQTEEAEEARSPRPNSLPPLLEETTEEAVAEDLARELVAMAFPREEGDWVELGEEAARGPCSPQLFRPDTPAPPPPPPEEDETPPPPSPEVD